MPLPEQLRLSLVEIAHHCERLKAEVSEALRNEDSSLLLGGRVEQGQQSTSERDLLLPDVLRSTASDPVKADNLASPQYGMVSPNSYDSTTTQEESFPLPYAVEEDPKIRQQSIPDGAPSISNGRLKHKQASGDHENDISRTKSSLSKKRMLELLKMEQEKGSETLAMILQEFLLSSKFFSSTDPELTFLQQIQEGMCFKLFCTFMICLNALYIGSEADWRAQNEFLRVQTMPQELADEPMAFKVFEWVFTVWFLIELIFRGVAERSAFFFGRERWWNFFDGFLVLTSLGTAVADNLQMSANYTFLRILRVFKLVRVVRVVRTVRWLKSLRTMVFSLLNSLVSLTWAILFIILILMVFGIVFINGVTVYVQAAQTTEEKAISQEMQVHFGTLYKTMVSLAASVTGGNDWMMYGELLQQLSEAYFMLFILYIFFVVIGLLNVVTGIFVDSAVCTRTEDEVVASFKEDQRRTQHEVIRIFKEADVAKKGHLSIDDLKHHLEDEWVRAYFAGLDLDPTEALSMFTLMDVDCDGKVDVDEFVNGCMKLKGHARSIDVLTIMYDNIKSFERLERHMNMIQEAQRVTQVGRASNPRGVATVPTA